MTDATTPATAPAPAAPATFDFDAAFQTTIAAFVARDTDFNRQTDGLIRPEYLEDLCEATIVAMCLEHWGKYKTIMSAPVFGDALRNAIATKRVRADMVEDIKNKYAELYKKAARPEFAADRAYVVEATATFARAQAVSEALLRCVTELIDKRRFDEIGVAIKQALLVGANQEDEYDFWERIEERKNIRRDKMAGLIKPTGITTGYKDIDELLYHHGWGREELTCLMGPAKSGKSMTLMTFAANGALDGKNVLLISLEVSREIVADRLDANISSTEMRNLQSHMARVAGHVADKRAAGAGDIVIHSFPSGSMKPSDLRRLLSRYRAKGKTFDLIVVDYADLMAPEHFMNDPIENSRSIYIDLRAIAQEENAALLTATQTNREGFKATVGKMEHVASDINKVRTVDLLISLNQTEDERAAGEARLFFAASRNQQGNHSVRVKCELSMAKYVSKVLGVE